MDQTQESMQYRNSLNVRKVTKWMLKKHGEDQIRVEENKTTQGDMNSMNCCTSFARQYKNEIAKRFAKFDRYYKNFAYEIPPDLPKILRLKLTQPIISRSKPFAIRIKNHTKLDIEVDQLGPTFLDLFTQ